MAVLPPEPNRQPMYCDRCNVEFTDGLRYCKWCGQALTDRPRVTSELHACPNCAAAVQPGWIFCKSCGVRLAAPVSDPGRVFCPTCGAGADATAASCSSCGTNLAPEPARPSHEGHSTSVIGGCSACGEKLDTGSMYCKACGAAVYEQARPFGGSALLCSVCRSYSPIGSTVCRVCGASLDVGSDSPTAPVARQKQNTLPDLPEHLTHDDNQGESGPDQVNSGANTSVFSGPDQAADPAALAGGDRPIASVGEKRTGGPGTNALPGVAGSKSEFPADTARVPRTRITTPVEGEIPADRPGSAELPSGESETVIISSPFVAAPLEKQKSAELPGSESETVIISSPFVAAPLEKQKSAELPGGESETVIISSPFVAAPLEKQKSAELPDGESETVIISSPFLAAPLEKQKSAELPSGESETVLISSPFNEAPVESHNVPAESRDRNSDPALLSSDSPGRRAGPFPTREQVSVTSFAEGRPVGDHPTAPDIGTLSPGAPLDLPRLQQKKLNGVAIASVVVVLIVLGGGGYLVWSLLAQKGPSQRPQAQVEEPKPLDTPPPAPAPAAPVVPEGMVMVKAGTYTIGRNDGDPIEAPGHPVKLAAYYIDRSEVTNADYAKFVEATRHKPPANWKGGSFPAGRDDFPVTAVSWQDAADYAAWAGKRLPSEAEWEAAARGSDARKYPWGNEWQSGFANIGVRTAEKVEATTYPSGIAEVGKYPQGASPSGAVDMIGNAWEWVADGISLYPGSSATLPTDDAKGTLRVIRGGAYDGDQKHDASYRGFLGGSLPYPKVGFRCAKSAGQ